jgi:ABC-type polysaccharide/polyol phosphate export permease
MSITLSSSEPRLEAFLSVLPISVRTLLDEPLRHPSKPLSFAWSEIVQNYRRSLLGPFWITLNLVIFVGCMTLVYGSLFSVRTDEYAGYLACGMIAWLWVSALLTDAGNTFIFYAHFVKNTPLDKSFLIWASAWKQALIFAHHLIVYVAFVLLGIVKLTVYSFLAIPAIIVLFAMSIPITAIMAILFPRFRDLSRLITSFMMVVLMVTPIFWQPQMLKGWRTLLISFNPIYYIVEFVRKPLLGQPLDPVTALVVPCMAVGFWILGAWFYRKYSKYAVFWL